MASIFNSREIAYILLSLCCFIYLYFRNKAFLQLFVSEVKGPLKVFFRNAHLLVILVISLVYALFEISLLEKWGIWSVNDTKMTIYWFVSCTALLLYRSLEAVEDKSYFLNAIKDHFKIIMVLEFVATLYTFPLWVEILSLPLIFAATLVYNHHPLQDKPDEESKYFALYLLGLYAMISLIYSVWNVYINAAVIDLPQVLKEFVLPIVLSLLFIPFSYLFVCFLTYEKAFRVSSIFLSGKLLWYARFLSVMCFNFDREALNRWCQILHTQSLNSSADVLNSILLVRKINKLEKQKTVINIDDGWSPFVANEYLKEIGLVTRDYNPCYGQYWFAMSDYKSLEGRSPLFSNNITYHMNGVEGRVQNFKLRLSINNRAHEATAKSVFMESCQKLLLAALGEDLTPKFKSAILSGCEVEDKVGNVLIKLLRTDWSASLDQAYELKLIISHPGWKDEII